MMAIVISYRNGYRRVLRSSRVILRSLPGAQFIDRSESRKEPPIRLKCAGSLVFPKPGASFFCPSSILSLCFCETGENREYHFERNSAPPDENTEAICFCFGALEEAGELTTSST